MTLTWESGLFFLGLFTLLGALHAFATRAIIRAEMTRGNGYRKVRDCEALKKSAEARLTLLEYEVLNRQGSVRSRFHEIANKLQIRLAKRELAKASEGAD